MTDTLDILDVIDIVLELNDEMLVEMGLEPHDETPGE